MNKNPSSTHSKSPEETGNATNHQHKFKVTVKDDLGREFGYCSHCLRDMQNLGNGLKVYQSHRRAGTKRELLASLKASVPTARKSKNRALMAETVLRIRQISGLIERESTRQ